MNKLIVFVLAFVLVGCTDATWSKYTSLGNQHKIELWSGGKMVQQWTSTGRVENETNSDGFIFMDRESGRRVSISGDVVITTLDK